jgi:enterochelin esterase-like enzyme
MRTVWQEATRRDRVQRSRSRSSAPAARCSAGLDTVQAIAVGEPESVRISRLCGWLLTVPLFAPLLCLMSLDSRAQPLPWVTEQVTAPRLEYRVFHSAAVGGSVSYHVLVPADYASSPTRRYPVIVYLHGSNSPTEGIAPMSMAYRQAMDSGLLPPALVVFPNGLPLGMWCDSVSGLQPVESMVVLDLLAEIDFAWRTLPGPRARLVEGFSMGGYGAARLGLRWPTLFGAASALGAGPMQLDFLVNDPNLQPLELRQRLLAEVYGNQLSEFELRSPWRIAEAAVAELPVTFRLRQWIGSADFTVHYNRLFHEHLVSLGLAHDWREIPGVGHSMTAILSATGPEFWRFHQAALADAALVQRDGFESP